MGAFFQDKFTLKPHQTAAREAHTHVPHAPMHALFLVTVQSGGSVRGQSCVKAQCRSESEVPGPWERLEGSSVCGDGEGGAHLLQDTPSQTLGQLGSRHESGE